MVISETVFSTETCFAVFTDLDVLLDQVAIHNSYYKIQ